MVAAVDSDSRRTRVEDRPKPTPTPATTPASKPGDKDPKASSTSGATTSRVTPTRDDYKLHVDDKNDFSADDLAKRQAPVYQGSTTRSTATTDTTRFDENDGAIVVTRRASSSGTTTTTTEVTGPNAGTVTPERAQAIRTYDQSLAKSDRPFEEDQKVLDALRGKSNLGELSDPEKKLLMDTSVGRWLNPKDPMDVNWGAIDRLGREAGGDPKTSAFVSEDYARRAVALNDNTKPGDPGAFDNREKAATLANGAVWAARTPENQRALLEKLGPEGSSSLAASLNLSELDGRHLGGSVAFGSSAGAEDRVFSANRLLQATADAPPTAASGAFVDRAFQTMGANAYTTGDFEFPGNTQGSMAKALANQWHADDPAKKESDGKRLEGIFRTSQGRDFLVNDNLPVESRLANLQLVASRPEWDAKFFQKTDNVYANPDVSFALAAPRMRDFAQLRGDTPRTLSGSDLDNTVGFSMGFPPQGIPANETDADRKAREAAVARGEFSYYRGEPASKVVDPIVSKIREIGGADPKVTVLPVEYASPQTGPVNQALFRVQDSRTGADRFVDNLGRSYDSFDDWKNNNKLPPGSMTYPVNGHLSPEAMMETKNTPATPDTFEKQLKSFVDKAALVGGTIAGGALILGSDGILAPAVVGAASAWNIYRTADDLRDRATHGQSINPLTDDTARMQWLGLGASALGLTALGATGAAARLAANGSTLAPAAATAAGFLRVGTAGLDAAAAANAGYTLIDHWDQLSSGDRAQLALSVGFWGANTAASLRSRPFDTEQIRSDVLAQRSGDPEIPANLQRLQNENPELARAVNDFNGPNAQQVRLRALDAAENDPAIRSLLENGGTGAVRLVGELGAPGFKQAFGDDVPASTIRDLVAARSDGASELLSLARTSPEDTRALAEGYDGYFRRSITDVVKSNGYRDGARFSKIAAASPDGLGYMMNEQGPDAVLARFKNDPEGLRVQADDLQDRFYKRAIDGTYLFKGPVPAGAPTPSHEQMAALAQRAGVDPGVLDNPAANPQAMQRIMEQMRSELPPEQRAELDREIQGRRFVDQDDYEAARRAGVPNPEDVYGRRDFANWQRASDLISDAARRGEPLTLDLLEGAQAEATRGFLPPDRQGALRSGENDWVMQGGKGPANIQSVSEAQYQALRSNPDLIVHEFGPGPDGTHQVSVTYTAPENVRTRVNEVLGSIDTRLARGDDPVKVAADVQRELVSIHPFFDGNGRTSRLAMDYVLERAGLPRSVLEDTGLDTHVSAEEWQNEVRNGLLRPWQSTIDAWARAQARGAE